MRRVLSLTILLGVAFALSCMGLSPHTGSTTCPSSGTVSILTAPAKSVYYTIQAPASPTANTGTVCFGGVGVTTTTGVCLLPGQAYTTPSFGNANSFDLSNVYIACTVNTDTIKYLYY